MILDKYFGKEVMNGVYQIVTAPLSHPDMIPTLLPLILGGVVLELYFGKYTEENLGWNSSVSNSVIWISTGITLILTANLTTIWGKGVSYFLIGLGLFTGYMNFFHKWNPTVAFIASSSGVVYSIAYVSVVMIKSGMPLNQTTIQSAALALIGIGICFHLIKFIEPSKKDLFGMEGSRI
ncbi:MAG: hypothetical protein ABEJ87_01165 [Candidatus Nanohalobium sp.]